MNVYLLYPDRDLDMGVAASAEAEVLAQDLSFEPVFAAMAGDDPLALQVVREVLLVHTSANPAIVTYRQDALADCLAHSDAVRALDARALQGLQEVRKLGFLGFYSRSPSLTLYSALQVGDIVVKTLHDIRKIAESFRDDFHSEAFQRLFQEIITTVTDGFLATVEGYRKELSGDQAWVAMARLGAGNRATHLALVRPRPRQRSWWSRWTEGERGDRRMSFTVAPADESGTNALREIRDAMVNEVANVLAQSNDHMLAFLRQLRTELAWYLACARLYDTLQQAGITPCRPVVGPPADRTLYARGLREVSLTLRLGAKVMGNDLDADGRSAIIITGANRGGKTTFLRALGQAECMAAAGMFVVASEFRTALSRRCFSHFPREENPAMMGGRLDDELQRFKAIVAGLSADDFLLLNESFSSTNEAEGSELARQVVGALSEGGVRVAFVTHLYAFARSWAAEGAQKRLFLRAERLADGERTFRILPGTPLETSYAHDVYQAVFEQD